MAQDRADARGRPSVPMMRVPNWRVQRPRFCEPPSGSRFVFLLWAKAWLAGAHPEGLQRPQVLQISRACA